MEIYDLTINGVHEPLGFEMASVRVSWKVRNTESKRAKNSVLTVAEDEACHHIVLQKSGANLNALGEVLDLALKARTRYYVSVKVTGDQGDAAEAKTWFETGKMDEPFEAKWISHQEEDHFHPVFFKGLALSGKPVSARLSVTGLGLSEAARNGQKVGNEYLAPYCNDYNEAVQVQTYDVTDQLTEGENCLEVFCGNGWFKGHHRI